MQVYIRDKDKKWGTATEAQILKKTSKEKWFPMYQQSPKKKVKGKWI